MHPVLVAFGSLNLRSYTACLAAALGFWFAYLRFYAAPRCPKIRDNFWLLFNIAGASAFFGARLLHIAAEPGPAGFAGFFSADDEGLSTFGAILGLLAGMALAARFIRTPARNLLDWVAPAAPICHGIARLGCFLNGCCYGRAAPREAFWTSTFTDPASAVPVRLLHTPLYSVQLYEAAGDFILGAALWAVLARRPERKPAGNGWAFAAYVVSYCLIRFSIIPFRAPAT